jgi:methyl-accepting chemotaxis protein
MNFDTAREKHAEWRFRFKTAIKNHEALDVEMIARDDCCDLGKWLYGEARAKYSRRKNYHECIDRHRDFHVEAGKVAVMINDKKFEAAMNAMSLGTGFSRASGALVGALSMLEEEIKKMLG